MPDGINTWLVFAGIMALGQFSPGPDMVLLTRTALASGKKAGCWTALGIACGLAVHAAIAVTGVALVITRGGWLTQGLKILAAAYLLYLASQLIRSGLRKDALRVETGTGSAKSSLINWKRGLFCNLLNPKVAIFLAGVSAPFLVMGNTPSAWPTILWLTIVLEGAVLWCVWVVVLQTPVIRKSYLAQAHWFDLAFGIALLALAVMLLLL